MIGANELSSARQGIAPGEVYNDPAGNAAPGSSKVDLGPVRDLRAAVQDLQDLLARVRQGDARLELNADYIAHTQTNITGLLSKVKAIGSPKMIGESDAVQRMQDLWGQAQVSPLLRDPAHPPATQDLLHQVDLVDEQCRKIVFEAAYWTIPDRLNGWLHEGRPGYYVPFHQVFEDELPTVADRTRVLNLLSWQPNLIKGLVDASTGLIYKYSQDSRVLVLSLLGLLAAFVAATALVWASPYVPADGWPIQAKDQSTLLIAWGAILTGIVVHIAVGTAKRIKSQDALPPVISLGDIPLIANAKAGQILLKLFMALFALFATVFVISATGGASAGGAASAGVAGVSSVAAMANLGPFNAFLIGYSLDSVVELFGASVEQRANAQVASMKKSLDDTAAG